MTRKAELQRNLTKAAGKALYGWGDNEPNEATGITTLIESEKLADAFFPIVNEECRATIERLRDRIIGPRPWDTVTVDGVIHRRTRPARYGMQPFDDIDLAFTQELENY